MKVCQAWIEPGGRCRRRAVRRVTLSTGRAAYEERMQRHGMRYTGGDPWYVVVDLCEEHNR